MTASTRARGGGGRLGPGLFGSGAPSGAFSFVGHGGEPESCACRGVCREGGMV